MAHVCPPCLYLCFARQDQQNLRILTSGLRQLGLSCGNKGHRERPDVGATTFRLPSSTLGQRLLTGKGLEAMV